MPRRSSKKQERDLNLLAKRVTGEATGEEPEAVTPEHGGKNPHAVALGRLGGKKGGKARAAKLTASQRSDIAKHAAIARWQKTG